MKFRITQEMMVFYKLYSEYRSNRDRWVPAWEFVGELFIKELNVWVLMSYKAPANGVNIFFANPGLVQRQKVTGRSGSKYYEYRIAPNPMPEKIRDPKLYDFYQRIRKGAALLEKVSAARAAASQSPVTV